MGNQTLFLKYETDNGETLTVTEDDKGFYLTDKAVDWDGVLFGEKPLINHDDVRDYAASTVLGHPLPFKLVYDASRSPF
ncbi:hypothetical protein [Marinobacter shengliensis]|uniref:hypothetical protein n=1 Tax=Marinobacter shengliensis TaxID=1389223 RepID=UPI001109695C|nr:hypothetical protein [Marinobacter shengliensis]